MYREASASARSAGEPSQNGTMRADLESELALQAVRLARLPPQEILAFAIEN
jgi:hypothetical protein